MTDCNNQEHIEICSVTKKSTNAITSNVRSSWQDTDKPGDEITSNPVRSLNLDISKDGYSDQTIEFKLARNRSCYGDNKIISKDVFITLPPKVLKLERIDPISLLDIQRIEFDEIKKLITQDKPHPALRLNKENHKVVAERFINLHTFYMKRVDISKTHYKFVKIDLKQGSMECFFIVIKDIITALFLKGMRFSKDEVYSSIIVTLFHWLNLLESIDKSGAHWMKIVKYKLAAFAAYWKCNNELPLPPFTINDSPKLLINGKVGKDINGCFGYFRTCIKNNYLCPELDDVETRVFYYSVFDTVCRGIKKGCPRATEDLLLADTISTFQKFTTPSPATDATVEQTCTRWCVDCGDRVRGCHNRVIVTPLDMEEEIRRTVREICGKSKFNPADHYNLNIPSVASATDCPRHRMGGLGRFVDPTLLLPISHAKLSGKTVNCTLEEPLQTRDFDNDVVRYTHDGRKIIDEIAMKPLEDLARKSTLGVMFEDDGLETIKESSSTFFNCIIQYCLNELPHMKAVALAEALKIRGITTPAAFATFLGKPMQKFIARLLLKFKCFQVTGGPITAEILMEMFPSLLNGDRFLSGDYDDATNKLRTRFSRVAIQEFCRILEVDPRLSFIFERNLCDGLMLDPVTRQYVGQQNAQPMGNILSFVILCTINAAATRLAYEIDHRRTVKLKHFPALINGDDFLSTFHSFAVWEKVLEVVGLKNSLGKTYFVKDFIEINSTSFVVEYGPQCNRTLSETILKFHKVEFINFGLAKMVKRSQLGTSDNDELVVDSEVERLLMIGSLGDCHSKLVETHPELYESLSDLFIFLNNDLLKDKLLESIQWYLPKWLGGLGMSPGPIPEKKYSSLDVKIMGEIFRNFEYYNPKVITLDVDFDLHNSLMKGLRGMGISSVISPVNYRYLTHEGVIYDLEEENMKIYNELKYLWFRETIEDYRKVVGNFKPKSLLKNHLSALKAQDDSYYLDESLISHYAGKSYRGETGFYQTNINYNPETQVIEKITSVGSVLVKSELINVELPQDFLEIPNEFLEVLEEESEQIIVDHQNDPETEILNEPKLKKELLLYRAEIDHTKRLKRTLLQNGHVMREALYNATHDYKERTYDLQKFLTCPQPSYLPIFKTWKDW